MRTLLFLLLLHNFCLGAVLYDVPLTRQATANSCGAAATQSVLGYYGIDYPESYLIRRLSGWFTGINIERIVDFLISEGLTVALKRNATIADLELHLRTGHPVIVEIQAWADEPTDYSQSWANGHYAIVIGLAQQTVYFMDPSLLGSRGYMAKAQFLKRWHELDSHGNKAYQTALFVSGKKNPFPAWDLIK